MRTGMDVLLSDGVPEVTGKRVGLISNHTGIDSRLRSTIDLLHASDMCNLVALFAPEHGIWGGAQAGAEISGHIDKRTGLPVYSLYGETNSPARDVLDTLDVLMFDMLDLGVRYATRLSIMAESQAAAAAAHVDFIVCDRPNPLSGEHVEGGLLDSRFTSLVGCHPIPVRHGMTVGELARLFAAECGWPEPIVVPMQGWQRAWWFDETGLPWVFPSPNLPTLEAATLYPGTCLIEGTNLSEGRGTTRPFELIGAPWLEPFAVAAALEQRNPRDVAFRPTYFTPTFSKHADVSCGGVQIHILDREALRPVALGMAVLEVLRALDPGSFVWRQGREGQYSIDLLLGTDQPRRMLDDGNDVAQVMTGWDAEVQAFEERRRPYLLYT